MDQVEKLCDEIALISGGHLLLSGSMREVKSTYPRNRVEIAFEGSDAFLKHPAIEQGKNYNGLAEIKLAPSSDLGHAAQSILAEALTMARISRFEVMEPTLEEIFIERVTTANVASRNGVSHAA
jgi:ABC-2 type transport system ATP-binding protein